MIKFRVRSMANELRPVRSRADYNRALAELERLWGACSGTSQGDRLDVLATLSDAWEAHHYPMSAPGSRSRAAEVLNRKQGLSIAMIRRLHVGLGIPADVLIRPTRQSAA